MADWRLLDTGARNGSENMAVDEALFSGVVSGVSPPTVRFFTWEPACLSLGFLQHPGSGLPDACRRHKVDMVRRPTGGLAVLHGQDLCYSVTARLGRGPLPAALQEAAFKINHALRAGLRLLGLPAEVTVAAEQAEPALACADAVSLSEVTIKGKKVIGSAQLFRNGCLLQHGSLTLDFDPAVLAAMLDLAREGIERLAGKATGLKQAIGREVSAAEATVALQEGFMTVLGISLEPGVLTPAEVVAAEKLSVKYRSFTTAGRFLSNDDAV